MNGNRHHVSLEHSPVPLYTLDPNDVITGASRSWLALLGYSEQEVLGHPLTEFQYAEPEAGRPNSVVPLTTNGDARDRERRFICRDGSLIDALVSEHVEQLGGTVRISCVLIDITARKQAEEALRVTEERLKQAQKMEAIGRLAAGVAHDFNNILQSIMGALELVLDDVAEGTGTHEFADVAHKAAIRGSSLTHHLLSYARRQRLQPQPVELAPFLSDMRKLLVRTLGPHISVSVSVTHGPSMLADPGQLQTALLNLAINASHAMPRGGELRLEAHERNAAGTRCAVVAVTDTGEGMDEATLLRAVEPFFTTKGVNGSGLGLSMVQGFAEQSGGGLSIRSVPGQGTTVELQMPLAPPDDSYDRAGAPEHGQFTGRILLVDDSRDVLLTMGAFLVKAGFDVIRADNATQALALLASSDPLDALITDFAMPGMNGAELIAEGRLIRPGLKSLIITGFAEFGLAEALPDLTCLLHKPVQRKDLIEALHGLIGQARDDVREPAAAIGLG